MPQFVQQLAGNLVDRTHSVVTANVPERFFDVAAAGRDGEPRAIAAEPYLFTETVVRGVEG